MRSTPLSRRLVPAALGFSLALSLGVAPLVACDSERAPDALTTATEADAEAEAGALDASFPILPYPDGPYGLAIGEVMPDVMIQGYRLSRTQRDSRKLPFSNIRLSEVRSDPACSCMVVIYNVAGITCPFCVDIDATIASIVTRDSTLCVAEIIAFSFDTIDPKHGYPPPTKADLDAVVENSRAPFPVGLATVSVHNAGFGIIPMIPDIFVMRPTDMRIAAFSSGSGEVESRIREACTTPWPPVETLTSQLTAPRQMAKGEDDAFVTDDGRVLRVSLRGGGITTLAVPPSTPDAIAFDATHVYWATHDGASDGGAAFEIGRVLRSGGAREVLTTSAAGYTSLALDGASVWFTRTDGVIASVPLSGGAETTFATEPGARSVAGDATNLYWIAKDEIVKSPKAGGDRSVLAKVSDIRTEVYAASEALELALGPSDVFVRARSTEGATIMAQIAKWGSTPRMVDGPPGTALGVSPAGTTYFAIHDPKVGSGAVYRFEPDPAKAGHRLLLTLGQHEIRTLAHDDTFAYWIDATDAGASLRRIQAQ